MILLCSSFSSVYADEEATETLPNRNTVSAELVGLDEYLSRTFNGNVYFNEGAALSDGYSEEAVSFVASNVQVMNELLSARGIGNVQLTEDYSVVISFPSTRANGESKVVYNWNGIMQIYMNSDEATELFNAVTSTGNTIAEVIGAAPSLGPLLGLATSLTTILYQSQIASAMAPGTGIIMNIYVDPTYGYETVWFTAQ